MELIEKAVICNTTGAPIATVKLPRNVAMIKMAGAYTCSGDAVNVSTNKVTADKRVLNKLANLAVPSAVLHEKSGTYHIE